MKKATVDIEKEFDMWLKSFDSKFTVRSYKHNLEIFFIWIKEKYGNIEELISLRTKDFREYLVYLKSLKPKISNTTQRMRIRSVSSFLSYLEEIEAVEKNYLKGLSRIPKNDFTRKLLIPNDIEIEIIEKSIKEELTSQGRGSKGKILSARSGLVAFLFVKHHALRSGSLNNITIRNGIFETVSKGSLVTQQLHPDIKTTMKILKLNKKQPLRLKTESFKQWFKRLNKRLEKAGMISHVYSFHDIRHYSAIQKYKESNDIYATMQFLNHKNISTTQIYLKGLGIII